MATLTSSSLSISSDLNLGGYDLSIQTLNHTDSIKHFSFYGKTNTSFMGSFTADSFLGNGGTSVFGGNFVKNPIFFNSFLFNFYSNASQVSSIVFEGQVQADTTLKVQSGYYNHLGVSYSTGDQVDFYGKNDYSANTLNLDSARFQSADGQTLTLKGTLIIKENVNQLFGKLSSFTYSDGHGHVSTLSGLSIDITSLTKTTSLTDLVPQLMSKNDNEMGTNAAEVMYGCDGNDTLNGGNGADTLIGGNGNDTYVINLNAQDQIQEAADGGFDSVVITTNNTPNAPITLNIADYANIEGLIVTGDGYYVLNGDANDNKLTGNSLFTIVNAGAGNDTLFGSGGGDLLSGGIGNDTYIIDDIQSLILENLNEGIDTIELAFSNSSSAITFNLGNYENVENLTVSGSGLFKLLGSTGNNVLKGNTSANTIDGNGGDDTMDGGAGGDIYFVDSTSDAVAEMQASATGGYDTVFASADFTLGDNIEKLVLSGIDNIRGTGNASANLIVGNDSNNTLDGGFGADTLQGGKGRDTYYVDDVNDVIVDGDAKSIIYSSSANYRLGRNFNNLTIVGKGDFNATGNFKNNLLTGNAGNNILNGGYGHDTLVGGAGDDTYILNLNALDEIHEEIDGGIDTFWFTNHNGTATPITLNVVDYQNIEGLRVSGIGLYNLIGDAHNNILTGNTYANLIDAGIGNDTLVSGGGKDTLVGGAGDDLYILSGRSVTINELANQGNDTLQVAYDNTGAAITIQLASFANIENIQVTGQGQFNLTGNEIGNVLIGNANNNVIDGLAGNDTLAGIGGADTLEGGRGADHFVFFNIEDSSPLHTVQINDFSQSETDALDFSMLDANTSSAGKQGFSFIQGNAFSNTEGELRFENGFLSGDTNGDGQADFMVHLLGVTTLSASDLILT